MTADTSLIHYLVRVSLALSVLVLGALVFVRYAKNRGLGVREGSSVKLLASLPLGKDVFFVVRCGPDVVAFTSGPGGACLMGRWKYEEWVCREDASASEKQEDGF